MYAPQPFSFSPNAFTSKKSSDTVENCHSFLSSDTFITLLSSAPFNLAILEIFSTTFIDISSPDKHENASERHRCIANAKWFTNSGPFISNHATYSLFLATYSYSSFVTFLHKENAPRFCSRNKSSRAAPLGSSLLESIAFRTIAVIRSSSKASTSISETNALGISGTGGFNQVAFTFFFGNTSVSPLSRYCNSLTRKRFTFTNLTSSCTPLNVRKAT
mmetsp:Transcript_8840/g.25735  ORF Transcript_8840/g.25735 Transcript_8840/m.25735 type:complete len:218 (+) Transcript_8840:192-845(+)